MERLTELSGVRLGILVESANEYYRQLKVSAMAA